MFNVQTSRKFVQLVVASIIVLVAILTVRGSAPLIAPRAHDSTNQLPSSRLAAGDVTIGFVHLLSEATSL